MNFLDRLALAVQRHEGWYPGSVSFRQHNPGNLRYQFFHKSYGATPGAYGFCIFPNYKTGFLALKNDLKAKITGKSSHIDYSKNPTFLDMMKVYAPREDHNDPNSYCQALIRQLKEYYLREDMLLSDMAKLVTQSSVGDFNANNGIKPSPKLKAVRKAIQRALHRGLIMVVNRLQRLENRLLTP